MPRYESSCPDDHGVALTREAVNGLPPIIMVYEDGWETLLGTRISIRNIPVRGPPAAEKPKMGGSALVGELVPLSGQAGVQKPCRSLAYTGVAAAIPTPASAIIITRRIISFPF